MMEEEAEPSAHMEQDGVHVTAAAEPARIRIHLQQGKAFIWRAEDACKIREEHGVLGNLVGALVRKPRQNMRLGLPVQLMPEEARLLVEIGAARLVHHRLDQEPSPHAGVSLVCTVMAHIYEEQGKLALQEKRRTLEGLSERIAEGRRKRKRKNVDQEEEPMESSSQGPIKELLNLEKTFHFPKNATMVQIPTAQLHTDNEEMVDIQEASSEWPYTGQKKHEDRYKVFRDLWQKGYYLTSGGKFGGDFLAYPGDPMRFHSHYIAICLSPDEDIALSDIITAGRLGTNVKKTVLLCSSNQEGQVTYTSLQWSGLQ
ncbi:tRNA-splicing endonuclease subunit Sen34 isoform X2 [Hyla sarda]|uniref:tRNA-splicing endonuclease subunit Sen34 isoform X2 n=1 Tax=Hyla sarda TaxID=327740 RepID=UPI0024C32298|nr:tRNA-splicing endonuclease subunit Sen34 isoform X2 [Hyla sarda]